MATLSGKWTLRAIEKESGWKQRVVITGSSASDGPHEMVEGDTLANVEGEEIQIVGQAFNPAANAWVDNLVQEIMSWDDATSLQVKLAFDDNLPHGDRDFNDLVVLCTAENNELASPLSGPRPDLTIPERFFRNR